MPSPPNTSASVSGLARESTAYAPGEVIAQALPRQAFAADHQAKHRQQQREQHEADREPTAPRAIACGAIASLLQARRNRTHRAPSNPARHSAITRAASPIRGPGRISSS